MGFGVAAGVHASGAIDLCVAVDAIQDFAHVRTSSSGHPDPIIRTLCAFANDFENLGGGYIIIGLEAKDGQPVLPPAGVLESQLNRIQRELLQYGNLIQPPYFPKVSIESYRGKKLVVLWAPGGQNRAYKAPKEADHRPPLPKSPYRGVPQRTQAHRRTLHGHSEDSGGNEGEWLAPAKVQH